MWRGPGRRVWEEGLVGERRRLGRGGGEVKGGGGGGGMVLSGGVGFL